MRVYFLNHSAPDDHLGGSELSLLLLLDAWRRRDPAFAPLVITPSSHGPFIAELRRKGIDYLILPFEGWALFADPGGRPEAALRIHRDFATTRRLIERMKADPPGLVVTNTVVAPWAAYAAAAIGIPHVWFIREFALAEHGFRFTGDREESLRDVGALSTLVVANSSAVQESLLPYVSDEKLTMSPPVVDLEAIVRRAAEPVPERPEPSVDLRLVSVGRITRTKGQWRIVEALGVLRERAVRASVTFVGSAVEGNADLELLRRARKLGVEDLVHFAGEQSNPLPFVRVADVGITASDQEAFGRATFEYLVLGKPVIATATGGTVELVQDGENGFLINPDDIDGLADRIEIYAHDPEIRARHGAAGLARVVDIAGAQHVETLIDRLIEAATHDVPRLPYTTTQWLAVPELFWPWAPRSATITVRARHLVRRLRAAARTPVASLRRRWDRLSRK